MFVLLSLRCRRLIRAAVCVRDHVTLTHDDNNLLYVVASVTFIYEY